MNIDAALDIFALGVKFGAEQSKLGLDIPSMTDDRLGEILFQGFETNIDAIEKHAKDLNIKSNQRSWYAENWTCQQSFHFGLMSMFEHYPTIKPDKGGKIILTNEDIDKLTQMQFRSTKQFNER